MKEDWDWDREQKKVIQSPVDERILVDAGPGTGKTAVACGRVAWLIDEGGISSVNIWLISFTRTAVQEMRNRIEEYLKNPIDAYSIKIATLDSHAWMIHSGFDSNAKLLGSSYDDNILEITNKIKKDESEEISDYLHKVEHIIIDEGQDIIGIRADLVLEIIGKLSKQCGITIFSDIAQSIYSFSIDEESVGFDGSKSTLLDKIADKFNGNFRTIHLTKLFRAQSDNLKKLCTETRQKVMDQTVDPIKKYSMICQEIRSLADDCNILDAYNDAMNDKNDCFILYRRRVEVLMTASIWGKKAHRIRMSGLPQSISPWVGACLAEHTKKRLSASEFADNWSVFVTGTILERGIDQGIDQELAWNQLVRLAGKTKFEVDMNLLRRRLGQRRPPVDFCTHEVGTRGPIIATIHSSKGREADNVYLMLPPEPKKNKKYPNSNYDEETRVVFVGATRARKWLGVGNGYQDHFGMPLNSSGRIFSISKELYNCARVQIGLDRDITASGIAGRNYYENSDTVRINQERLCELADKITNAEAINDHTCDHVYRLIPEDDEVDIAALSNPELREDLWKIGKKINGRPPEIIKQLRIYGIRTIILPEESQECNGLHEPWTKSGIMLAPVINGYTNIDFPFYKKKAVY